MCAFPLVYFAGSSSAPLIFAYTHTADVDIFLNSKMFICYSVIPIHTHAFTLSLFLHRCKCFRFCRFYGGYKDFVSLSFGLCVCCSFFFFFFFVVIFLRVYILSISICVFVRCVYWISIVSTYSQNIYIYWNKQSLFILYRVFPPRRLLVQSVK